jgi:hypothetical protein
VAYAPPSGYGYPLPAYVAPTNQQSSISSYITKPKSFPSLDPFVDNKNKWISL